MALATGTKLLKSDGTRLLLPAGEAQLANGTDAGDKCCCGGDPCSGQCNSIAVGIYSVDAEGNPVDLFTGNLTRNGCEWSGTISHGGDSTNVSIIAVGVDHWSMSGFGIELFTAPYGGGTLPLAVGSWTKTDPLGAILDSMSCND